MNRLWVSRRSHVIAISLYGLVLGASLAALIAALDQLLGGGGSYEPGVAIAVTALAAGAVGLWVGAPLEGLGTAHHRWVFASGMSVIGTALMAFRGVYQGLLPAPWWFVLSLFICLALPVYGIGMIPPMVLATAEGWWDAFDEEATEEVGWGALGVLSIGALIGAIVGLLVVGAWIIPQWNSSGGSMFAAVLLFLPALLRFDPRTGTDEETLFHAFTPYGEVQVTEISFPGQRQPERRLYLNGEEESGELVRSGAPTLAYIAAAEQLLTKVTPRGSSYLFLGGGAYTLPRRVVERDSSAEVTAVELDPEITALAERYFGLKKQHSIRRIHGDGRAWLMAGTEPLFDRIYVDVYAGAEALPWGLITQEGVQAMDRRLAPDGLVAWNLIGSLQGGEELRFWSALRTIESVFPHVVLYHHLGPDFPDRQNFLVVAGREPHGFPRMAGTFEKWEREDWPPREDAIVFLDLDPGAAQPAKRARRLADPVSEYGG